MGIFRKGKEFIDTLEKSIQDVFRESIEVSGFVLKEYLVNDQLYEKGIDGDGNKITPGYKRTTIRIKIGKGQPVDRVTLHDKEEFVDSIEINAFNDRFEISSNVSYDKYILKKYGRNVLKITNENMREFLEDFYLPRLKQINNDNIAR